MQARTFVFAVVWLAVSACGGGDSASSSTCMAGERSQPGSSADPCLQVGTECAGTGRTASALCGPDGVWLLCECDAAPMTCGNQIREGTEECDGTDLAGSTCGDFVAGGVGTLACDPVTCSYDDSLCTTSAGGAGNGTGGAGG